MQAAEKGQHSGKGKRMDFYRTPLWDSSLPIEERLDFLLQEMTKEEKLKCLTTGCIDIPRLGIRAFSHGGEAAHGIEARHDQAFNKGEPEPTTAFSQPIGMSASWDRELLKEIGTAVGNEARVLHQKNPTGGLCRWAPTVDMERDPRWGRNEESYGEDPFLTGEMAGAYIRGMKGDDPFYLRCGATLKHFYANNQEKDRISTSSSVDPRNKWEYYLEPFRRAIHAGAEAVMTSYNEINGVPAIVNPEVQEVLKDTLHLPGHVVCDGGDMQQTVTDHHFFRTHAETVAEGLKAGIDCFTDDKDVVEAAAKEAVEKGLVGWEEIDRAIRNSFRTRIRLGLYDRDKENPYRDIPEEVLNSEKHRELARRVVQESAVLLKNDDHFLPLEKGKKIAVAGPWADVWYKDWYCGIPPYSVTIKEGIQNAGMAEEVRCFDGYDRIRIRTANGWLGVQENGAVTEGAETEAEQFRLEDWGNGQYLLFSEKHGRYLTVSEEQNVSVTSKEAFGWFIREAVHMEVQADGSVRLKSWEDRPLVISGEKRMACVSQEEARMLPEEAGTYRIETVTDGTKELRRLAKWADVVIYAAGCNPVINSKEEIDRPDIELPGHQKRQLSAAAEENGKTLFLLVSNYPYALETERELVPAILQCASGSQEIGNGLADLIFGKVSPAGRLPMTWNRESEALPPMEEYDIIRGKRTYQYADQNVRYPFGYGLSFTEFSYRQLETSLSESPKNGDGYLKASLLVKNEGSVTGDEVVQIYTRQNDSRAVRPIRQLRAFERVRSLAPGEERKVTFEIPLEDLRYYDVVTGQMVLETGSYTVSAGASSEDLRLSETVWIEGETIPARNPYAAVRADHYDDCSGSFLYQGHEKKCAVYAKEKTALLEYRDLMFEETPRKLRVLLQGQGSGTLRVLAGEQKELLAEVTCENGGKPVWKEIPLKSRVVENLPRKEKATVWLELCGTVGIAEFYFDR